MTDVTFGAVPKPPIIELIVSKLGDGHGYNRLAAPRENVGICEHITDGHGSIEWYRSFFGIGGERESDALVDFIVGRDGRIGMLNDWRGTRAPWANGNLLGLEGDGPAFLNKFGVSGVNRQLVSIEHEGTAAEDWTTAEWNASVALDAWLFDQMGVRFDSYPIHQDYGIVTHLLHSEFTNKGGNTEDECPGRYLHRNITRFQSDVRARMNQFQSASPPIEPITPTAGAIWWPEGAVGPQPRPSDGAIAIAMKGQVTFKRDTPLRISANSAAGKNVIGTAKMGTQAVLFGTHRSDKNQKWGMVRLDGYDGYPRVLLRWLTPDFPTL